jgi:steroid delta-isomerase-like uncharacterized protein
MLFINIVLLYAFMKCHISHCYLTTMEKEQQQQLSSTNINTKKQQQQEDKNEALAKRYHEDIYQKGNLEVADEILSSDFVLHNPTLPEELRNGSEGAKKYASAIITAVPDRKLVQDDIFAIDDKVIIRWTNSGTNTGSLFGSPPTGKPYITTGIDLFRISNGKISEMWQQYNFAKWP